MGGLGGQLLEKERLGIRFRQDLFHLNLLGNRPEVQFLKYVPIVADQLGTLLDEAVGAPAGRRKNATGDSQDLPVLLQCHVGGDEGTTGRSRLDDEVMPAADRLVDRWSVPPRRRGHRD